MIRPKFFLLAVAILVLVVFPSRTPAEDESDRETAEEPDETADTPSAQEDETEEENQENTADAFVRLPRERNITLGAGVGTGIHLTKRRFNEDVDATTAASTEIPGERQTTVGAAVQLFADFGFIRSRHGNFGIATQFNFSAPDLFFGFSLTPRYRLEINLHNPILRSISPYIGLNFAFSFIEKINSDFYFNAGITLGVELQLFIPNLYFRFMAECNMGNPIGTEGTLEWAGQSYGYDQRYNNYVITVSIGYRLL